MEDNTGAPLAGESYVFVTGSGFETFGSGTTPTSMELLGASYTFKAKYGGTGYFQVQNVKFNQDVEFVVPGSSAKGYSARALTKFSNEFWC